ncbi:MAG: hypothetical protein ACK4MD_06875 [Demequina sp.]
MTQFIEWEALANIVVVGILVGAGLPILFAVGVRALAGPGARDFEGRIPRGRLVLAWTCFGTAVAAIGIAIAFLAAGGH